MCLCLYFLGGAFLFLYFFEFVYSVLFCGASCVRSGLVLELRVRVRVSALGTSRIKPASPSTSLTGATPTSGRRRWWRRGVVGSLDAPVVFSSFVCSLGRSFFHSFIPCSFIFLYILAFGGGRGRGVLASLRLDFGLWMRRIRLEFRVSSGLELRVRGRSGPWLVPVLVLPNSGRAAFGA
jgi:hypothetical protein